MSIFISCIPPTGLIEMPPVSKVTPLPTSPSVSPPPPLGSAATISRGSSALPCETATRPPMPSLGDLLAAEHLDLDRLVRGGDLLGALGQLARA